MKARAGQLSQPGDLLVPDNLVVGRGMEGPAPALLPTPQVLPRGLNRAAIRRLLRAAPKLLRDSLLDVITDESASVRGGNDVIGHRHELILIAAEHLAGVKAQAHWHIRVSSFDHPSVFDLPITRLDRRGLHTAQQVLMRGSPGSSSILGPSLRRSEEAAARFRGPRLLVVASDYELYDQPDPVAVLAAMVTSTANEVLAISLNNEPPAALMNTRVHTARITAADAPADLANHIVDAARACVRTR